MQFSDTEATKVGDRLNIDWNIVPLPVWRTGLEVELEHGTRLATPGIQTNVTGDDLYQTGQIVLAHLIEDPRYYQRLTQMEKEGDAYWEGKQKPSPVIESGKKGGDCGCGGAPVIGGGERNMTLIVALLLIIILLIAVIAHSISNIAQWRCGDTVANKYGV